MNGDKTLEERVARLEQEHEQFLNLVVSAGGKLASLPEDATYEDLRKLAREVGGQLLGVRNVKKGR